MPARLSVSRISVFLVLLFCAFGVAAQYKWTEPDGRVGYGDQPPRNATKVERIDANAGAPSEADEFAGLPYELRRAAKNFPVTLYAAAGSDCAPCASARAFLRARAIPYHERTIGTARDLAAYQALGGDTRLPALAVGRNFLRGYEPSGWAEALNSAGYPQNSALPRAWQWPAPMPLTTPEPPPPPATPVEEAPAAGESPGGESN